MNELNKWRNTVKIPVLKKYITKKELVVIIVDILFLLMWFIDAFYQQINASDYKEYYDVYNGLKANYFELGYYWLGVLFRSVGIPYFGYRMFLVTITLLLMRNSILKYSKYPIYITVLYSFYPFMLQCIQMRNALTMSIIIFSLRYLKQDEKQPIKFIGLMIIGLLFHSTTILYFILVLMLIVSYKWLIRFSIVIIPLLEVVLYFFKYEIAYFLSEVLHQYRILYYFEQGKNVFLTKSMLVYLFLFVIVVYLYKKQEEVKFNTTLLVSSALILTYIPLMIVHYDYYRIYEFYFPVIFTAITNALNEDNRKDKIIKYGLMILFACITFYLSISWIQNTQMVLHNNILFK